MTAEPHVLAIFIAPDAGAPMQRVDACRAIADTGLDGDRYARQCGTFSARSPAVAGSRPISVFSAEAVEECNRRLGTELPAQVMRRNLLVQGLELKDCIGQRLRIGEVELDVLSTCPPCGYLSGLLGADMRVGLKHLGGVRTNVRVGGLLTAGSPIVRIDD